MSDEQPSPDANQAEQPFNAEMIALARSMKIDLLETLGTEEMAYDAFPRKLLHYTNLAGFKSIIETQTLWATDSRYLNDSQELLYGERVISEQLSLSASRYTDALAVNLVNALASSFSSLEHGITVFSVSFSECEDDLSQWRGYGSSLGGIALQMDIRPFACEYEGFELTKVVYDRTEQNALIDSLIDSIIDLHARISATCSPFIAGIECSSAFRAATLPLILKFKNAHFAAEREWRLIRVHEIYEPVPNLLHRIASGSLVPYLAIPLRSQHGVLRNQLPVEGVRLGPNPNAAFVLRSVAEFMRHHGYSLRDGPTVSSISLR